MIVLTLSKCPPGLKGDVTKWLMEISTGVYVGKLSARVRDLLWKRICDNCGTGEATMIFSARNEQGFSCYVRNTEWRPIDFDGITLMRRPKPKSNDTENSAKKGAREKKKKEISKDVVTDISSGIINGSLAAPLSFTAIDLETSGLKSKEDNIIEIAAVRYVQSEPVAEYHALIQSDKQIPDDVKQLTGIKDDMLKREGIEPRQALTAFIEFIGNDLLVGHYISFDIRFLKNACLQNKIPFGNHRVADTIALSKSNCSLSVQSYRLEDLVKALNIAERQEHRALPDAYLAAELYLKLNEK